MQRTETGKNVMLGAAAGAAGTVLIRGMMAGTKRFAPKTLPPMKDDPGHFMVKKAEHALPARVQERIPEQAEAVAAQALAFGYGMAFGSLYAAMDRREGNLIGDGALLGAVTWGAGYLGWLPAVKLMPPVWKQKPKQVLPNILSHVLFGIATVALFKWARQKV